ncbi:unnamed protein product [Rhizoctonia solani]|uniref:Concentrative nucleoside transporter N-terminal domain-containing protein n=1 Tax=Rhizoctonia solani TaxID=456999 RepID=A0A8H3DUN2_9AGAM|nr:unnamed protein product [Rhizoctonia solani]
MGLDTEIQSEIPTDPAFQIIRDLRNLSNQFPTWLTDKDSYQFKLLPSRCQSLKDELCSDFVAIKNRNPERFHQEEDPGLASAIDLIFRVCRHNRILNSCFNPNKSERRLIVDSLLSHICEEAGEAVLYRAEQELRLPPAKVGRYNVTHTTADGAMLVGVTGFKPYDDNLNLQTAATALNLQTPRDLQVVHCVTEFKQEGSGANQAIMGMVSAIHQKKALGVLGQFTFGVFQHQANFLQIFAAAWQANEGKIKLYEIGIYSLNNPVHVVRFYLVIRGIVGVAGNYLQQLRESEPMLATQVEITPPAANWTPFRMDILEAGGSNAQGTSRRLALKLLPASEECDARNRVLSYLESISQPASNAADGAIPILPTSSIAQLLYLDCCRWSAIRVMILTSLTFSIVPNHLCQRKKAFLVDALDIYGPVTFILIIAFRFIPNSDITSPVGAVWQPIISRPLFSPSYHLPEGTSYDRAISNLGLLVFTTGFWLSSKHRSQVPWPTTMVGLFIQQLVVLFVLKTDAGFKPFLWIADFLDQADPAARFSFDAEIIAKHWVFVNTLGAIFFFITFVQMLYYLEKIQWLIK